MTKTTTTKKKKVVPSLKNIIRKRYETGEDLIGLALEYKINYGTLRNISSKEKWEKGKAITLARIKEVFESAEEVRKKKEEIKKDYEEIISDLRGFAKETNNPKAKDKEEAFYKRAMAIETLYKIDKELHSIYSEKELLELQKERVKYEELKQKILLNNNDNSNTLVEDEDLK